MGCSDKWWTISDDLSGRQAGAAIREVLSVNVLPFLERFPTDQSILDAYASGEWKLSLPDAREVQIILLAALGMNEQASDRVKHYEIDFRSGLASRRACDFLERFDCAYPGLR